VSHRWFTNARRRENASRISGAFQALLWRSFPSYILRFCAVLTSDCFTIYWYAVLPKFSPTTVHASCILVHASIQRIREQNLSFGMSYMP
jgi:hypothetical protein